jgi:hypothetical protein
VDLPFLRGVLFLVGGGGVDSLVVCNNPNFWKIENKLFNSKYQNFEPTKTFISI